MTMNGLITIVGDGLNSWEEEPHDSNRYSIFTQNLMLAEKVSKCQHLAPRASRFREDDERSFHSAESRARTIVRADSPTIPEEDVPPTTPIEVTAQPPLPKSGSIQANIGRPRTSGRRTQQTSQSSSGDWTWRPSIPQRVSSMETRRKKGVVPARPDLATFHRRSCQLFTSLDTTLSNATNRDARGTGSPNGSLASTSPSLASSISTQATSVLDDNWHTTPAFPSFHLDLQDPTRASQYKWSISPDFGDFLSEVNHTPHLAVRRSSSQLSPHITSTEPIFWTSETTRQAEYAKIDAAHTGFKGFVKRLFPRRWAWVHGKRRNFHPSPSMPIEVESPKADDDSVRRFRVSIASATQEAIRGVEEHGVSEMNSPVRCASPFVTDDDIYADNTDIHTHDKYSTKIHKPAPTKPRPVNKVLAKVRSSDALAKMFRSQTNKLQKVDRRAKTLSRELGY